MLFSRKKIPKDGAAELVRFPIKRLKPYRLALAPCYVYLPKNEKFISIKEPMDFFTEEEIQKLNFYEDVYYPPFVTCTDPFTLTAAALRKVLNWKPDIEIADSDQPFPMVTLPPPKFELSKNTLSKIGPLWGKQFGIEPFFVSLFVDELCGHLPPKDLEMARDISVDRFEEAVFISSGVVFLALHMGYVELDYVKRVRLDLFKHHATGTPICTRNFDIHELLKLVKLGLEETEYSSLRGESFRSHRVRSSEKLAYRIQVVMDEYLSLAIESPSVKGGSGFQDV